MRVKSLRYLFAYERDMKCQHTSKQSVTAAEAFAEWFVTTDLRQFEGAGLC